MCTQYLHIFTLSHFPPPTNRFSHQAGVVQPSCSPILYKEKEENDILAYSSFFLWFLFDTTNCG
jgi:hypothetical protein